MSTDTISRITDRVVDEMTTWMARPVEPIYAAVFIDAIVSKVRDGQVRNQPYYAAIGVDLDGHKDILGIWPGNGGGESAKLWFACLTELKNRGVKDVFFMVCDGLKDLPDSIGSVFPAAKIQTCLIPLLRNSFSYASKRHWPEIAVNLNPVYEAPDPEAAEQAFEEFTEKVGQGLPGHDQTLTQCLHRVRSVPGLRRPRSAKSPLQHERDREPQCPLPQGCPRQGSFPERAGRAEDPVSDREIVGPQGHQPNPVGHALEARVERASPITLADRMPAASTRQ